MKAVILAGGRGERMYPNLDDDPKPLLRVCDKPLIQYSFEALPDSITEVIVVLNHKAERISNFLGDSFLGRNITIVHNNLFDGTAGALWCARPHLGERFLVTNADDICQKADIVKCAVYNLAMLVYRSPGRVPVASVRVKDGMVVDVIEGAAAHEESPLVNAGVYALTPDVFNHHRVPKDDGSSEFCLPQTILAAYPNMIHAVEAGFWLSVTEPSDIQKAEEALRAHPQ